MHYRGFLLGGRWEKEPKDNDCSKNFIHTLKQNTKPLVKTWIKNWCMKKTVYEGQVINLVLIYLTTYTKYFIVGK